MDMTHAMTRRRRLPLSCLAINSELPAISVIDRPRPCVKRTSRKRYLRFVSVRHSYVYVLPLSALDADSGPVLPVVSTRVPFLV